MDRTVKNWADTSGIKPDTARKKASRILGRLVGQMSVLTPDEWAQVYPDTNNAVRVVVPDTDKPVKKKDSTVFINPAVAKVPPPEFSFPDISTVRRFALDCLLIGIVVGHAGLIWYDCADLWEMPGRIGGGLAFFIIVAALMLSTDPTKNITSQIALFLAFLVDVGAWFVHRPVFETYRVDGTVTDVLCVFLCLMSFGALLIYRHQKNN